MTIPSNTVLNRKAESNARHACRPLQTSRHRTGASILRQVPVRDEQEPVSKTDASVVKLSWWGRASRNPSTTAQFRVWNPKQSPHWICE